MPGITHTGPCGIKAAHPLTVWKPVRLRNPLYFLVLTGSKMAACDQDALSPDTWGFEGSLPPDLCHPHVTTVSPNTAPLIKEGALPSRPGVILSPLPNALPD